MSWYSCITVMPCAAALSIWSLVDGWAMSRSLSVWEVCWVLVVVVGLPNWYRSMRFRGMGNMNGWWLRRVAIFWFFLESGVLMFPICGRSSIRA